MTKPDKAPFGSPCNGCGLCCLAEQCPMSAAMFGPQDRCPALVDAGPLFRCGMVTDPAEFIPGLSAEAAEAVREGFTVMLGIGENCDAVYTDADQRRAARIAGLMHAKWEESAAEAAESGLIDRFAAALKSVGPHADSP